MLESVADDLPGGSRLLSRPQRVQLRPRPLPRVPGRGQGRAGHPGHRQPERLIAGRMGPLRAADPGCRGRRARAERLLRGGRSRRHRRSRSSGATSTSWPPSARPSPSRWRSRSARSSAPSASMAAQLVDAGADGLVLFNRFLQPDIDLETLRVAPSLQLLDARRELGCRCGGSRSSGTGPVRARWRRPAASIRPRTRSSCCWPGPTSRMLAVGADQARARTSWPSSATGWTCGWRRTEYDSVEQAKGSLSKASPGPTRPRSSAPTTSRSWSRSRAGSRPRGPRGGRDPAPKAVRRGRSDDSGRRLAPGGDRRPGPAAPPERRQAVADGRHPHPPHGSAAGRA